MRKGSQNDAGMDTPGTDFSYFPGKGCFIEIIVFLKEKPTFSRFRASRKRPKPFKNQCQIEAMKKDSQKIEKGSRNGAQREVGKVLDFSMFWVCRENGRKIEACSAGAAKRSRRCRPGGPDATKPAKPECD